MAFGASPESCDPLGADPRIPSTLLPNHLEPTRTGDPRIRADQRNAERDGGAGDQAVERVTKRRKGPRLDHVPSLQGQEEKCRITLDRVAPFVERGSQADPPAFLEPSHLEKADRGHGNPDPTRFGTTDEATGLSTEGLPNTAQVEDQRRRVENGTGLTHGVDGESAPNERCDARGSRRLVPELSDGLKELVWRAEQLDAAAQTCKGPFHPSRFGRRRRMRRQADDWPSAARQHDHLTGAAHLVGDSAEVAARVDDRNALRHLNTGSVHFDFRPPQRG